MLKMRQIGYVIASDNHKRITPILLLCAAFCFSNFQSFSQTWTEDFQSVNCAAGSGCDASLVGWTIVSSGTNGSTANQWYVSIAESGLAAGGCGTGGSGVDQSLHVGNVAGSAAAGFFCPGGDCGAAYDASGANEVTNKRVESPIIDLSGGASYTVTFNYIEGGEGTNDNATLWYNDGSTWSQISDMGKTATCGGGQGLWTAFSVNLPASADNNSNVQIAFNWTNNGNSVGSDPSFAVDDIAITASVSLEVDLLSFNAYCEGKDEHLVEWSTAQESDVEKFVVMGYTENGHIDYVGTSPANNSNYTSFYTLKVPETSKSELFELVEYTYNGEKTVLAMSYLPDECRIHTDPIISISGHTLSVSNIENFDRILVHDLSGRTIAQDAITPDASERLELQLTEVISSGIYVVTLSSAHKYYSSKVIID